MKLERFGRYLLLDHLVDGGMAKICRARFLGDQADKVVAIKMVQPQFSADDSFRQMFMDEIKLTFGLLHPNIVQTYDYGLHNNQLFVAMEYCDGRNLKQYLDKLTERGYVFPVEISVYIITQVCQALDYAHKFEDKLSGKKANIVHRDISPHNIMLTYDGAVKVIDFGIAKAETNSEKTQAGTIKGKLSYLAPEYLEGEELDPRYDEFAVGITLWEMLCSRKLFTANNDLAVLKKIQECKIPAPSSINPRVPKELDQIVLKSLSKNREERYENLDLMNRELIKFLYKSYPDFNSSDLSFFARELYKEEISKDNEKLREFGKIDIRPYLEDLKNESSGNAASSSKQSDTNSSSNTVAFDEDTGIIKGTETKLELDAEDISLASALEIETKKSSSSNNTDSFTKTGTRTSNTAKNSTSAGTNTRRINQTRAGSQKTDDSTKTKTNIRPGATRVRKKPQKKKSKSGIIYAASIIGALFIGYEFFGENLFNKMDQTTVTTETRVPSSAAEVEVAKFGRMQIEPYDRFNQKVYINSKVQKLGVLGDFEVPLDKSLTLRIERQGYQHFVKTLEVRNADRTEIVSIPTDLPRASYGYIYTGSDCINGKLFFELFGESREVNLPISSKRGIALALDRDSSGNDISTTYDVKYLRVGESFPRNGTITIAKKDQRVDVCSELK